MNMICWSGEVGSAAMAVWRQAWVSYELSVFRWLLHFAGLSGVVGVGCVLAEKT